MESPFGTNGTGPWREREGATSSTSKKASFDKRCSKISLWSCQCISFSRCQPKSPMWIVKAALCHPIDYISWKFIEINKLPGYILLCQHFTWVLLSWFMAVSKLYFFILKYLFTYFSYVGLKRQLLCIASLQNDIVQNPKFLSSCSENRTFLIYKFNSF